jgi:hypothetical protein
MKLFDYETYEDYGKEWFLQVLTFRKFALFDFTVQWDDYGTDKVFPAIQLSIGSSHLFGLYFRWKRLQFDCSVIDTASRDLEWYRRNK